MYTYIDLLVPQINGQSVREATCEDVLAALQHPSPFIHLTVLRIHSQEPQPKGLCACVCVCMCSYQRLTMLYCAELVSFLVLQKLQCHRRRMWRRWNWSNRFAAGWACSSWNPPISRASTCRRWWRARRRIWTAG